MKWIVINLETHERKVCSSEMEANAYAKNLKRFQILIQNDNQA